MRLLKSFLFSYKEGDMNAALDEVRFGWAREYFERQNFAETVAQLTQMESDNLEGLASFHGEVVGTLSRAGKDELIYQLAKWHLERKHVSIAAYVLRFITGDPTNAHCDLALAIFNRSMRCQRYEDAVHVAFFVRHQEEVSRQLLILGEGLQEDEPDLAVSALHLVTHDMGRRKALLDAIPAERVINAPLKNSCR
jgi:hypothetical protein